MRRIQVTQHRGSLGSLVYIGHVVVISTKKHVFEIQDVSQFTIIPDAERIKELRVKFLLFSPQGESIRTLFTSYEEELGKKAVNVALKLVEKNKLDFVPIRCELIGDLSELKLPPSCHFRVLGKKILPT